MNSTYLVHIGAWHPSRSCRLLHPVWIILSIHDGSVGMMDLDVMLPCWYTLKENDATPRNPNLVKTYMGQTCATIVVIFNGPVFRRPEGLVGFNHGGTKVVQIVNSERKWRLWNICILYLWELNLAWHRAKNVVRPSYLYNENFCIVKMTLLHWDGPL